MAINQNVNINVNANTENASQDIDRLENNIKTLDGAINLVGGSIAALAGGLVATGAVTEEQADNFNQAALGAIALAEGSKRALEGFRVLAQETDVVAKASRLLNKVLNANPYILIATAIAGLAVAYAAFRRDQRDNTKEVETANEKLERQIELLKNAERVNQSGEAQLRKFTSAAERNNTTIEEEIRLERERLDAAEERARKVASIESDADREKRRLQLENIAEANALVDEAEKLLAQNRIKRGKEEEDERERQLKLRREAVAEEKRLEQEAFDEFEKQYNKRLALERKELRRRIDADVARAEAAKLVADAEIEAERKAQEFKEMAITDGIDNIQGALGALFQENKAVASANVLIDAAQAGVGIIKNSQSTGPLAIAYQVSQFALLTATTLAALRDINSAQPGDSDYSGPRGGGGGIPQTSFGLGTSTIGGATGTVAPSFSQGQPMRAYVLSGDVANGLEADSLLNTRRQFP